MPTRGPAVRRLVASGLLIAGLLTQVPVAARAGTVDPALLGDATGRPVEALVVLTEQADLSGVAALPTRQAKGREVVARRRAVAARTQPDLLAALTAAGIEHRAYWIENMVWVRADGQALARIAARPEVARVVANPRVRMALPRPRPAGRLVPDGIEPNIEFTRAPEVFWAAGFRGQGVVVAAGDTGQDFTHPALRRAYRGFDGQQVVHDYNWWDAIHTGGGRCGADSPRPCDDDDHGTATMGVIVGDDGAGNQIGMAPAARWIGCRNMDQGTGTPATYTECFQFFLAPTDLAGNDPRPDLAPEVINNSWRCPDFEGCTDPDVLRAPVEALTAAGIVVVASAGNDGRTCGILDAPPAIYDAAWTVGSCNTFGEVSAFSSRGPVIVDDSGRVKPDFISVGENVRTSIPGGGYAEFDGTSLSGPHVVGLTALTISSLPCLSGKLVIMEQHLRDHTFSYDTSETCGGIPGDVLPNNTNGWGIVQAALPDPGLCTSLLLSGIATGLTGQGAVCRNETTGQSVTVPLAGGVAWNCLAAGLAVAPGDRISQGVRGTVTGIGTVGASVTGQSPKRVLCRNDTSGQTVVLQPDGATSWSCEAGGLVVAPGDRVTQGARGPLAGAGSPQRP